MDGEHIEQIRETKKIDQSEDLKLKKEKNLKRSSGKPCIFYKDEVCRIPFCDLEVCSKCPHGHIYCINESTNPLKKILHKIIGIAMFLAAFIGEENIIYEALERMLTSV